MNSNFYQNGNSLVVVVVVTRDKHVKEYPIMGHFGVSIPGTLRRSV